MNTQSTPGNLEKWLPESIPVFVRLEKEYGLSDKEGRLLGFISMWRLSVKKPFYFSNAHLGAVISAKDTTVSLALKKLCECGFIKLTYKIKSDGGKIRFVELCCIKSRTFNPLKVGLLTHQKILKKISKQEDKENLSALRDGEEGSEKEIKTEQNERESSGGILGRGINFDPTKDSSAKPRKTSSGITEKEKLVLGAFQVISPTTTARTKSFAEGIRPLVNKLDKLYSGKGEEKLAQAISLYLSNPKSVEILQKSPFLKTPKIFFRNFGEILLSLVTSIQNASNPTAKTLSEDGRRRIEKANKTALAKLDGNSGGE